MNTLRSAKTGNETLPSSLLVRWRRVVVAVGFIQFSVGDDEVDIDSATGEGRTQTERKHRNEYLKLSPTSLPSNCRSPVSWHRRVRLVIVFMLIAIGSCSLVAKYDSLDLRRNRIGHQLTIVNCVLLLFFHDQPWQSPERFNNSCVEYS